MENCYSCEMQFDENKVKRHDEHIIPNAIGGRLLSRDILCEKCGGRLGVEVDSPLNNQLNVFAVLYGIMRDRGETKKAAIDVVSKATPKGARSNFSFSLTDDFAIIPNQPIYFQNDEEKIVTICCSLSKQAEAFGQNKEIVKLRESGYSVVVEPNMAKFVAESALHVDPESGAVLKGVAKIAIEYALYCGISFEYLKHFKDNIVAGNSDALLRSAVIQYYPVTDEEKLYETGKFRHEDWHPNHQLILFSDNKFLYCYVELFGSIQKYVRLSNNYSGPLVMDKYMQKVNSWNFDPKQWEGGPKELHMFASELGIPFHGRDFQDVQNEILNKARIRSYELDPDTQIEKVQNLVHSLISHSISNIKGIEVVDELLRKADEAKSGLGFTLVDKLKQNPLIAMQWIYKDFSSFRVQAGSECCPDAAASVNTQDLRQYALFRLYETLCSVGKENEIKFVDRK